MSFSNETFAFLRDLEKNNAKEWFEANRHRYEASWKSAALDFITDIAKDMAHQDPPLKAEARLNGSLRRINRDVRFSKDKSPYNPRLHLIFWAGAHPNRSPGMHIVLQSGGVGYGAGQFGIDPKALSVLRARILDKTDGNALQSAVKKAATVDCSMGEPELARLPKGYTVDGPRADLLRRKSFVARTYGNPVSKEVIIGPDGKSWVLQTTETLMPLIRWLNASKS
ncbi:MAG: DUF2461 domain-containing protein [Boseongicola sp.]